MSKIPTTKQEQKYHLSMAGEFFVAAELQRQGFSAAVTYGNAKRADVVAFSMSGEHSVVIEVKTTSEPKWIIGRCLPNESSKPWVLVYLPIEPTQAPIYYVLLQSQLRDALLPADVAYRQKFREVHGEEYGDRPGVVSFTRLQAEECGCRGKWETITALLLN